MFNVLYVSTQNQAYRAKYVEELCIITEEKSTVLNLKILFLL